jgi:phosphohistidine phosphatase SixA
VRTILLIIFFSYSCIVSAQNDNSLAASPLVSMLQQGGYVIYFRHAATDHSIDDQHPVDLNDCSTQRNLNEQGKEEARIIGEEFIRLNIPIGNIYSSPFCRCKETAEIAFGKYELNNNLYYAIALEPKIRKKQNIVLNKMLGTIPNNNMNTVIVAHTSNLREAAGVWPKPEGAAYVFKPLTDGSFKILGQIHPNDWSSTK